MNVFATTNEKDAKKMVSSSLSYGDYNNKKTKLLCLLVGQGSN